MPDSKNKWGAWDNGNFIARDFVIYYGQKYQVGIAYLEDVPNGYVPIHFPNTPNKILRVRASHLKRHLTV